MQEAGPTDAGLCAPGRPPSRAGQLRPGVSLLPGAGSWGSRRSPGVPVLTAGVPRSLRPQRGARTLPSPSEPREGRRGCVRPPRARSPRGPSTRSHPALGARLFHPVLGPESQPELRSIAERCPSPGHGARLSHVVVNSRWGDRPDPCQRAALSLRVCGVGPAVVSSAVSFRGSVTPPPPHGGFRGSLPCWGDHRPPGAVRSAWRDSALSRAHAPRGAL